VVTTFTIWVVVVLVMTTVDTRVVSWVVGKTVVEMTVMVVAGIETSEQVFSNMRRERILPGPVDILVDVMVLLNVKVWTCVVIEVVVTG
jgi:hypothetical protein